MSDLISKILYPFFKDLVLPFMVPIISFLIINLLQSRKQQRSENKLIMKRMDHYIPVNNEKNNEEDPMSWKDAAKVSIVITITQVFVVFLTVYEWLDILADQASFLFNLFKFFGITFFGTFAALIGLSRYFSEYDDDKSGETTDKVIK